MYRVFLTLICSFLLALPFVARGAGESCAVEGITARWAMSYCMTRFETDDEANPGVSACLMGELKQKSVDEDCEANIAYKSAICSILIGFGTIEGSLAECVASDAMIPSVVTDGVG